MAAATGTVLRLLGRDQPALPLVEAATAALFVAVTLRLLALDMPWALAAYLYFSALAIVLTLIDLDVKRLPDTIVLPSYAVTAVLLGIAAFGTDEWWPLGRAVICAAAMAAGYGVFAAVYRARMGPGRANLAALLGAFMGYLSWWAAVFAVLTTFLLGALVSAGFNLARARGRRTTLPVGPLLIVGAFITLFTATP